MVEPSTASFEVVAPLLVCSWMFSIYSVFFKFCATAWLTTSVSVCRQVGIFDTNYRQFLLQGISPSDTQQFSTTTYYYILGTYTYEYSVLHYSFYIFEISSTRIKRTDVLFKPINHICQIAFILNSVKIQKHQVLSELHRIMVLQAM